MAFDLELLLQAVNSKSLPELPSLWHTLLAKLKDETRSAVRARYQATLTQALVPATLWFHCRFEDGFTCLV